MRAAYLLVPALFHVACDSTSPPAGSNQGGSAGGDASCSAPLSGDHPLSVTPPGHEAGGPYDPALELDPTSGRLWLSYSSVGYAQSSVSTRLAYSNDGGASWCDAGAVNPAASEPSPPAGLAGHPARWQHEVSDIAYDPAAAPEARWKLLWHRYLHVDDGSGDPRKFAHGWIGLREAASPEALAAAPEQKMLAGAAYDLDPATTQYNDAVLGPLPLHVAEVNPALAPCIVLTEPGMLATAGKLYLSLQCIALPPAPMTIVLLERSADGPWSYTGTLLGQAEAQAIDASYTSFAGPELVESGGRTLLLVDPVAGGGPYDGCVGYDVDLASASLLDPTPLFHLRGESGSYQSGPCAYHAAATATGMLLGDVMVSDNVAFFRLWTTGVVP